MGKQLAKARPVSRRYLMKEGVLPWGGQETEITKTIGGAGKGALGLDGKKCRQDETLGPKE